MYMLNRAGDKQLPYGTPLYVLVSLSSILTEVFRRHLQIILISLTLIPIAIILVVKKSLLTESYALLRSIKAMCLLLAKLAEYFRVRIACSSFLSSSKSVISLHRLTSTPRSGLNPVCAIPIFPFSPYSCGSFFCSIQISMSLVVAVRTEMFLMSSFEEHAVPSFESGIIFAWNKYFGQYS